MIPFRSYARGKWPVLLLVIAVSLSFSAERGYSQQRKKNGNIVSYKGNKIEFTTPAVYDTFIAIDPQTQEERLVLMKAQLKPIRINGRKVYELSEVDKIPEVKNGKLKEMVLQELGELFRQLPDGIYNAGFSNVVMDKKGEIAYYEFDGLRQDGGDTGAKDYQVLQDLRQEMVKRVDKLLRRVSATPARVNGKKADVYLNDDTYLPSSVKVKDHRVQQ
jgi:hypothetical protein